MIQGYDVMLPEHLRILQKIQVEMLCEVRRICEKNNIKYCIIAGTFLGAIRHKKHIPWDDDADVAMIRDEYEKFKKACEIDLNKEKFYFQCFENTKGYRWGYGKLRRKDSLFIRKGQEHMTYESGVFIDIFPLDSVPDNKILRILHNFYCFIVRKLMWAPVGYKSEKNVVVRFIYYLMSKLPENTAFVWYEKLLKLSSNPKTKMVRILTFPTPKGRDFGYYRKWYSNLDKIEFDNEIFACPRDKDEYLRYKFGDYMQLPPKEQRGGHNFSMYRLPEEDKI